MKENLKLLLAKVQELGTTLENDLDCHDHDNVISAYERCNTIINDLEELIMMES